MEINDIQAADSSVDQGESDPFDWATPIVHITDANSGDVATNASSDYDNDLFEPQEREEVYSTTERKRALRELCQGAPLRRKKKPKSLPKRPLSAYNLYFQRVRAELNSNSGAKIGFHELGKIVGKKWKSLSNDDLKEYKELAKKDSERYRREMERHNKMEAERNAEEQRSQRAQMQDERVGNWRPNSGVPVPPSYAHASSYPYASYSVQPHARYAPIWSNEDAASSPFHSSFYPGYNTIDSSRVFEEISKRGTPLPSGSEVHLRDESGELRAYVVQYAIVSMSREEAQNYMDRLKCKS